LFFPAFGYAVGSKFGRFPVYKITHPSGSFGPRFSITICDRVNAALQNRGIDVIVVANDGDRGYGEIHSLIVNKYAEKFDDGIKSLYDVPR
jgi:hypothetical protein